jgi:glyoxylase-like metal-dependent hydrolase (beta-lactamase superfamily II)
MKLTENVYMVASGDFGHAFTNYLDCNAYLIDCGVGAIMIDSGANVEIELIDEVIRSHGFDHSYIKKLVLTHSHADHACGAAHIKQLSGCEVYAPAKEAEFVMSREKVLKVKRKGGFYPEGYAYTVCPDVKGLEEGDTVSLGNVTLTCYAVPGHCLQHMVLYGKVDGRDVLFSGDAIFPDGKILLQCNPDVCTYDYWIALKKVRKGRNIDSLFPGHGAASILRGGRHLDAAIAYFDQGLVPPQLFYSF